jgi:hypothetical protein
MWPPASQEQGAENCLLPDAIRLKMRQGDNIKVKFLDTPQYVKQQKQNITYRQAVAAICYVTELF